MIEKSRRDRPLPATDSTPRPGDFPPGSPESRAAARLRLEFMNDDRDRIKIVSHIPRPGVNITRPHATQWAQWDEGKLGRVLYVPHGMEESEARRIIDAGGPA